MTSTPLTFQGSGDAAIPEGQVFLNTDTGRISVYLGGKWVDVVSAVAALTADRDKYLADLRRVRLVVERVIRTRAVYAENAEGCQDDDCD